MFEALLQALISGLAVGGAYALVALGFSITFTTTKTLNFSHGEFVSAGAFVGMSVLFLVLGKPLSSTSFGELVPGAGAQLAALLAALAVMGGLGWLLYVLGVRPFAGRPGMAWVMSTLGFGVILQSLGLAIWGPKPVVVPGPVGDDVIRWAVFGMKVGVRPQELLMLAVAVVIMLVFDRVMNRTLLGKAMRAVAHNGQVASLMGINVNAVMIGAFVFSSALAGLSGFMLAPVAQASLFMGLAVGAEGLFGCHDRRPEQPARLRDRRLPAGRAGVDGQPVAGAVARGRDLCAGDRRAGHPAHGPVRHAHGGEGMTALRSA
jgi:branched-chain amino acid transport system permease protein